MCLLAAAIPSRAQLTISESGFTVTNLGSTQGSKQIECSPGGAWGDYVYFANSIYNLIERVDYAGVPSLFANLAPNSFPVGLAFGPGPAANFGNYLYVANWGNSTIVKIDPSGTVTPFTTLATPTSNTFDPSGAYSTDMFVTTGYTGPIYTVDPLGVATPFAAVPSLYIKFGPGGAWGTGMYSTSQSAVGIVKVDNAGVATNFATGYTNPEGFDWADGPLFMGDMFSCDVTDNVIYRVQSDGTKTVWGTTVTAADVAFCNGTLYVTTFHGDCFTVTDDAPVPVAFGEVLAIVKKDGVELVWNAAVSGESVVGFDIRRSSGGAPASVLNGAYLAPGTWRYKDTTARPGSTYEYVIVAVTTDGEFVSPPIPASTAPVAFSATNYPNPFNPSTTIDYSLPQAATVSLQIFDVHGALVLTLDSGRRDAGTHSVEWNGRDESGRPVASGTYFYRLSAGAQTLTQKMVLLK